MHRDHHDIHEHGLADDCGDCEVYADYPYGLDRIMLSNLIERNFLFRFGKDGERDENWPRSHNEEIAMANITNTMEHMGKLFETAPHWCEKYLRERWHVVIIAGS